MFLMVIFCDKTEYSHIIYNSFADVKTKMLGQQNIQIVQYTMWGLVLIGLWDLVEGGKPH